MHLLNTQTKTAHLVENLVRRFGPFEGRALRVVRVDIGENGGAQLRHARVRSATQGLLRQQAKEALDEVQPGRIGGREMQVETRVSKQPAMDRGGPVRREIVQDQ